MELPKGYTQQKRQQQPRPTNQPIQGDQVFSFNTGSVRGEKAKGYSLFTQGMNVISAITITIAATNTKSSKISESKMFHCMSLVIFPSNSHKLFGLSG
jgi:hypothetical protein